MNILHTRSRACLLGSAGLLALVVSAPAFSQTPTPAADQAAQVDGEATSIVVTALRRSVSVQDIPASITAVSGDTLLSRGVTDTIALANVIPGLVFVPNFGNTIVTIRGVGSTSVAGSSEPTVAIYSDGAYLPRPFMGTLRAVDLDRVEVLRGPQGTLYGLSLIHISEPTRP